MGLLDGLFGKKKRTLKDLALDDLARERITLQQEQRKLDTEAQRLITDEGQLKAEYAEADNQTQKRIVARKIQDSRMRQKANDTKSSHCHKMLQTVNNFLLIKENMAFFERMGVASMLVNMDMAEIEKFVTDATIEGSLQQEKLATMLQQVSDGVEQITQTSGDVALDDLMSELDGEVARRSQTAAPADAGLADVMNELDAAISKGAQAARQAAKGAPPLKSPAKGSDQES